MEMEPVALQPADPLEPAFEMMTRKQIDAVITMTTIFKKEVVDLAMKHRLPLLSTARVVPASGGLASYSPDYNAQWRDTADYIDKILKGSKPADLPVAFPTKFELVINLKTAKALGLTVSPMLLGPRRRGDRMKRTTPMHDRHPEVPASSRASKDARPPTLPLACDAAVTEPSPFEARPRGLAPQGDGVRKSPLAAVCIDRRAFIGTLGCAAASSVFWPFAARAQEKVRRIGVLVNLAEGDSAGQTFVAGFRQALQELGWVDGRNARIDMRWGAGRSRTLSQVCG